MEKLPNQNPENRKTVFGLEKKREQVIEMLNNALTGNDLDVVAYEKRMEITLKAQSVEELEETVYDFPNAYLIFPNLKPNQNALQENTNFQPAINQGFNKLATTGKKSNFINILSGKKLSVHDLRSAGFTVSTGLGETIIDLREMSKYCTEITIQSYNLLGNVKIQVSGNTVVRQQFANILGNASERVRNPENPSIFTRIFGQKPPPFSADQSKPILFVNLVGINLLGEISIEYEREESKF